MNTELFPFSPNDDDPDATRADKPQDDVPQGDAPQDEAPQDEAPQDEAPRSETDPHRAHRQHTEREPDLEAVPDDAPEEAPRAPSGTWEGDLERLRARFPGQRDGTLFCVYKLEQDRELSLRDFRAEAELRCVPLSGRSLHTAKVLLGLAAPAKPRRRATTVDEDATEILPAESVTAPRARRVTTPAALTTGADPDLEAVLRSAIDHAAGEQTEALRDAIRQAIDILQAALD